MQACLTPARVQITRSPSRQISFPHCRLSHSFTDRPHHQLSRHSQLTQEAQLLRCSKVEDLPVSSKESDAPVIPSSSVLDIRVGKILSCEVHPEAEKLYVESIDVGEEEPRTIVSGLVNYVPLEELQDRMVMVICNLKAAKMRGVKSNGMLLCASDKDGNEIVEPLDPPEGAVVGERVYFGANAEQEAAETPNRMKKKKMWVALQPLLSTSDAKVAELDGQPMNTSAGPVTAKSLANAPIS